MDSAEFVNVLGKKTNKLINELVSSESDRSYLREEFINNYNEVVSRQKLKDYVETARKNSKLNEIVLLRRSIMSEKRKLNQLLKEVTETPEHSQENVTETLQLPKKKAKTGQVFLQSFGSELEDGNDDMFTQISIDNVSVEQMAIDVPVKAMAVDVSVKTMPADVSVKEMSAENICHQEEDDSKKIE